MDLGSLTTVAAGFYLFALVSGRLQGTVVTAPLVFILFGFLLGDGGLGVADVDPGHAVIHTIAELTLVLVLFTDAVRIDLRLVRADHDLPVRMLLVGLPFTMLAGALVASWVFPSFSVWEAALLAALLAPTDAALGQPVVSDPAVPVRIRQAINVESGLNDGIALPAVLLFSTLAGAGPVDVTDWVRFVALQVTLGPVVGIVIGFAGARLLDEAVDRGWTSGTFQGIGILALAGLAFGVAELVGGNGFIAAFVGGLAFGHALRHPCTFLLEFMETEGQLLMLVTFVVFGAALLPVGLSHLSPATLGYAALSLTAVRMIPVAASFVGTDVKAPTRLFLGWFGPRGLASILFVLLILEDAPVPHAEELLAITVLTVAMSALLHGVSAAPLAARYGRLTSTMGACAETTPVTALPVRGATGERTSIV